MKWQVRRVVWEAVFSSEWMCSFFGVLLSIGNGYGLIPPFLVVLVPTEGEVGSSKYTELTTSY